MLPGEEEFIFHINIKEIQTIWWNTKPVLHTIDNTDRKQTNKHHKVCNSTPAIFCT